MPTGAQNFYVQNDVQGQARFPVGAEGHAMGEASEERRRVVAVRGWNTLPSVERQANHALGEHHAHGKSKGEAKQCVERNSYREAKTCRRLNYGMLGVEKSSQLIVSYSVLMKRVRWRKTPFFHCIDITSFNTYILLQARCEAHPESPQLTGGGRFDQLSFWGRDCTAASWIKSHTQCEASSFNLKKFGSQTRKNGNASQLQELL